MTATQNPNMTIFHFNM